MTMEGPERMPRRVPTCSSVMATGAVMSLSDRGSSESDEGESDRSVCIPNNKFLVTCNILFCQSEMCVETKRISLHEQAVPYKNASDSL